MDDLVSVGLANSEGEAISLCALLESAGIKSTYRVTNFVISSLSGATNASSDSDDDLKIRSVFSVLMFNLSRNGRSPSAEATS